MNVENENLFLNGFVSKEGEKIFGCAKCPHRKHTVEWHVHEFRNRSNNDGFMPIYLSPNCPRYSGRCEFNVYASPEYLACDKESAKNFREGNAWLKKFYGEFQKSSASDRKRIVEKYFQKIAHRIDLEFGAEDEVRCFFFALNWDVKMKNGESFLELAKSLILAEALSRESLGKLD